MEKKTKLDLNAIVTLVAIHMQYKLLALPEDDIVHSNFCIWKTDDLDILKNKFKLTSDEQDWIDAVVIPSPDALDALTYRMYEKLPTLQSSTQNKLVVREITSRIIKAILSTEAVYDARMRATLRSMANSLLIQKTDSEKSEQNSQLEESILFLSEKDAIMLMSSLNKSSSNSSNSINEEPETEKETNTKKYKRWAGVGAAGVLGGVIIGVSGGLAAPLVAAGLGSLSASLGIAGVASSVAVIGTASGAALVGSIFGITGAGLAGYKLNKHLKDLEEFYFTPLSNSGTCLSYTIVISGWIENLEESTTQWEPMIKDYSNHEIIALSFERESLVKLSAAIYDYIKSNAIYTGAQAGVALTSAAALAFALTIPIGLLTTVSMIDNPWNLTLTKSEMAGRILARSVVATYQGGKRPITLVGHGMGARVIVYCLVELYSMRNDMDVYGLIDSVFLLGAAASLSIETWNEIRQIVAGRFVNCFSKNDWFLHLLFRLHSNPAAGEDEIDIDSIENFDVSERVATHVDYVKDLDSILKLVNYDM